MNSVAHQLRRSLRFFVAVILLLALPLIGMTPRAAAMDDHSMHTQQHDTALDCAAACARAMNVPPTTSVIKEDQTRAPDPEPQEIIPYHVQFQVTRAPKKLRPAAMYGAMPSRPPDIVKSSGHFLF